MYTRDLLRNTVEVVSGICECTAEAIEDLRDTLGFFFFDRGMELFCARAPPVSTAWVSSQKLTDPRATPS